jgi:tetratricopeptide (TPR) repeat protein
MRRFGFFVLMMLLLLAILPVGAQPTLWESTMRAARESTRKRDFATAEKQYRLALTQPEQEGQRVESLSALASVYTTQLKYADAEECWRQVLAVQERLYGMEDRRLVDTLTRLAQTCEGRRHLEITEQLLRRALAIQEQATDPAGREASLTRVQLAEYLIRTGRSAEAEPYYLQALGDLEAHRGLADVATRDSSKLLARHLHNAGEVARAEPIYRKWLACTEKAEGPFGNEIIEITCEMGTVYHLLGREVNAETMLRRAVAVEQRKRESGSKQIITPWAYYWLAECLARQGKYADAQGVLDLCFADGALGTGSTPEALTAQGLLYYTRGCERYGLGRGLLRSGISLEVAEAVPWIRAGDAADQLPPKEFTQAEPLLRRAVEMRERTLWSENPWRKAVQEKALAESLNNLAVVLLAQGQTDGAKLLLDRALQLLEDGVTLLPLTTGGSHPGLPAADPASVLVNRAVAVQVSMQRDAAPDEQQRRFEQAESLLTQVRTWRERRYGREGLPVMQCWWQLAALRSRSAPAQVREPLTRALAIANKHLDPAHPDVLALAGWLEQIPGGE